MHECQLWVKIVFYVQMSSVDKVLALSMSIKYGGRLESMNGSQVRAKFELSGTRFELDFAIKTYIGDYPLRHGQTWTRFLCPDICTLPVLFTQFMSCTYSAYLDMYICVALKNGHITRKEGKKEEDPKRRRKGSLDYGYFPISAENKSTFYLYLKKSALSLPLERFFMPYYLLTYFFLLLP